MSNSFVKRCWTTGLPLLRRISVGGSRDFAAADRKLGARMTMSTGVNSTPSSRIMSPWLTLPPVFSAGGDMVYKFYNLADDKEESFPRNSEEEIPVDDDTKFVGSSHGWLALLNQRNNNHLFLYNPITRRQIKLPPIETLPNAEGIVSKLILSSSPDDDDECTAMMTFGPLDGLAFCQPCRRSTKWTPIGQLLFGGYLTNPLSAGELLLRGRAYEDFVYCARLKRFSCITQFEIQLYSRKLVHPTHELEHWDLSDPHSPISTTFSDPFVSLDFDLDGEEWMNQNMSLLYDCRQIPYLVFTEQHNQLFVVIRFVMDRTIGFCVLKVDYLEKEKVRMKLMKGGNLDGLTMFIGMNHSFAVSADEYPNLKPNSIYFTDANKHAANSINGGHDNGIFDYVNKALSPLPCYSNPCVDDSKRVAPPPMWYTPSLGK